MKKQEKMGKALVVPVVIGNTPGRSSTFSNAVSAKGSSDARKFVVTPAKDYALATIDNLEIETSKDKKGGIVDMLKLNVDGALDAVANSLSQSLFGDGTGVIGHVSAVAALVVTLTDIEKIVNFEIGQVIVTASGTHTGTVAAIDRSAGKFTMAAGGTIVTADTNIFVAGDENNKLVGLAGWLPYVAPVSGDSFFSLDRSVDVTRLAGVRYDGSAITIEKALLNGAAIAREGGRPDLCLVNFAKFEELVQVLGAQVRFKDVKGAHYGFEALTIRGPKGPIKVIADANAPDDYAFMLDMRSWKLASTGPAVHILDRDSKVMRESTTDAYEVRVASYSQLVCDAPGWNGVIKLD